MRPISVTIRKGQSPSFSFPERVSTYIFSSNKFYNGVELWVYSLETKKI